MDGGSTDDTLDILNNYQLDPRLHFISEPDAGQYDAVNKGFSRACGEIIGWINADDVYTKHAVREVVHEFLNDKGIDIVYGRLRGFLEYDDHVRDLFCRDFSHKWLKRYCYTNPSATFLRAALVKDHKFNIDLSIPTYGDWDWFLRMAQSGKKFKHLPEVISIFRIHPTSRIMTMTRQQRKKERILLSSRHGMTPGYISFWSDHIIPWYERVINGIHLIIEGRWSCFFNRLISLYSYIRNSIHK
jgi:glycosyltransferase involved in cell wall biosynthesis